MISNEYLPLMQLFKASPKVAYGQFLQFLQFLSYKINLHGLYQITSVALIAQLQVTFCFMIHGHAATGLNVTYIYLI